ncbi:MAG: helix-turn-helix domain-containing protein [Nitrospirota bacterium]
MSTLDHITQLGPHRPPRKQAGQGLGPRRIDGSALDVRAAAAFLGISEKAMRARVTRRLVPFRRLGERGRIVFLRAELEAFLSALDGCPLDEALANLRGDRQ